MKYDKKKEREFWKEQFELGCNDVFGWIRKAEKLRFAADILRKEVDKRFVMLYQAAKTNDYSEVDTYEKPDISSVWSMIAGYSIECILKAIYISYQEDVSSEGKFNIEWPGSGHNLEELVNLIKNELKLKFDLDQDEKFLLKRFSAYTSWAGRYPFSKKVDDILPVKIPPKGRGPVTSTSSKDENTYQGLYIKLINVSPNIAKFFKFEDDCNGTK